MTRIALDVLAAGQDGPQPSPTFGYILAAGMIVATAFVLAAFISLASTSTPTAKPEGARHGHGYIDVD
jgi:hypothetical protein